MNMKHVLSLGLIVLGLSTIGLAQGPTGAIYGIVVDVQKKPITGASVILSGPSILGYKSFLCGKSGAFQFPLLFSGLYEIRAEMPGHKSKILKGIRVEIGKAIDLKIELSPSETEEDIITAARTPSLDVRSAVWTVTLDASLLEHFPRNRDVYDLLSTIPTALNEDRPFDRTAAITGGTARGQQFGLDGSAVNDIAAGTGSSNLNTDVFNQVEFDLAGRRADSVQSEGAYINIVTKGGGNDTHGSLYYGTTGKGLTQDLFTADTLRSLGVGAPRQYSKSRDFSLDLSGPIWDDRAWYYLGLRRLGWDEVNPASPESRMARLGFTDSPHYDLSHRETMFFAKVTVQPTNQIRYTGNFHLGHVYEPVYAGAFGDDVAFPTTTILDGENDTITAHQVVYTLNQNTHVELRALYFYRSIPLVSQVQGEYTQYDAKEKIFWGSAPYNSLSGRSKLSATLSLTHFAERLLGVQHELRFGAEFEQSDAHQDWYRTNPYYIYWRDYAARDPYYLGDGMGLLRIVPAPDAAAKWDVQDSLRRFSAFAQDNIKAGPIALSLGVRFDYSLASQPSQSRPSLSWNARPFLLNPEIVDPAILLTTLADQYHARNTGSPFDTLAEADKNNAEFLTLSPRFGLVVDLFGNGRTALKFSLGRTFEPVWLDKYRTSQIFAPGTVDYLWIDLNGNGVMDLLPDDTYRLLSAPSQDPKFTAFQSLKVPYSDELSAGIEQDIASGFKIGVRFVWKRSRHLIEDIDAANGYDPAARDAVGPIWLPLSVTDPGWDGRLGTADDRALTVYGLRADRPAPNFLGSNPSQAERSFRAAAFTFEKRMSDNWQLQGSIAWTSFTGNTQADFLSALGRTAQFNSPNTVLSATAPLAIDRPLQVRILGTYCLPWNFVLSAYFQHYSGAPVVRTLERVYFPANYMGFGTREPFTSVALETDDGHRGPAFTNVDLRLEKHFGLSSTGRLSLILDVFNLLGRSGQNVDQNPGGILRSDLAQATYTASATFGKALSVYGVRSFRLGARISF